MDLEILTKIDKIVAGANQIAIILPEKLNIDLVCSAQVLHQKLTVIDGKQVSIFSSAKKTPKLEFFPNHQLNIYSSLGSNNELTIKVSGQRVVPKQLRYEKKQNDLIIYIAPEINKQNSEDGASESKTLTSNSGSEQFNLSDVEVFPAATGFDLLIILGAENLEGLGSLYQNTSEVFYNTPKISINNKIEQEYFATLTWVEAEVPSLSQLVGQWFLSSGDDSFKNDIISTGLLAGIISSTQSFSDPRTTPDTLALASKLVSSGARRQDIIKYLFKTKPFNLLQLWGRALARIKTFQENTILYTVITAQDFTKTKTDEQFLPDVLSEIISMANNYKLIILAAEVSGGVDLLFAAPPHIKIKQIAKNIDPTFSGQAENLIGNYQYLKLNLPNFKLEDLEQFVATLATLGTTGI